MERRKAATDKAIATTEEEAQQLLAHSDVKTTRKHYIAPRGMKPTLSEAGEIT